MDITRKYYDFIIVLPFFLFLFASALSPNLLWDDYFFIFESEKITSAPNPLVYWWKDSGYTRSWSLGYSFLWILYHTFFDNYAFYKMCNLAIHFINYLLLKEIGKCYGFSARYHIVALLFLVHPLNVETLSWIFQSIPFSP